MTIFKKPYIFIIIFIGIMLSNVLIVESTCWQTTPTVTYSDCIGVDYCCACVEFCDDVYGSQGNFLFAKGRWCGGDDRCSPLVPGVINTGRLTHRWMCDGPCSGSGGPPGVPVIP